jgi:sulfate/thiosulfate transport system substrate-binding protein
MHGIRFRNRLALAGAVCAGVATLVGLAASPAGRATLNGTQLTLVAYSTPKEAYGQIISAFGKTPAGKGVSFSQSYGASGEQSRAVYNGLGADIVAFSLAPDITKLVGPGLVDRSWNKDKYKGMVTDSVVVFVVRDGNPKHVKTWSDLVKPGIGVVTPNPFTSGGAQWNVMAAYGAQRKQGKSHKQAVQYLTNLFKHVVSEDTSARQALQTFSTGKGDVLITYENEAIFANKKGVHTDYVVPKQTILIENPAAPIKTSKHLAAAKAFVKFLHTAPAQTIFAENGYRPTLKSVAAKYKFPRPKGLFTINAPTLGGWDKVKRRFFDKSNGIMLTVQRNARK